MNVWKQSKPYIVRILYVMMASLVELRSYGGNLNTENIIFTSSLLANSGKIVISVSYDYNIHNS